MSSLARFLEGWSTFYTAMVGGTTVLMGLVFLAVSLRLEVFTRGGLHEPREVAWQTFINFFWVFVISLVFLIPGASGTALAVILTSLSVAGLFLVLRRWRRSEHRGVSAAVALLFRARCQQCVELLRLSQPRSRGSGARLPGWYCGVQRLGTAVCVPASRRAGG